MKFENSADSVDGIRERVSAALNTCAQCILIDCYRYSGKPPILLHCRGRWPGGRFFAKVLLANPYPKAPRIMFPARTALPPGNDCPVEDQIESEWNMTSELRALGGPDRVPAPLAKSIRAKTIVWEERRGTRLDHLVLRSRWAEPKGTAIEAALFQAGNWLRKIHYESVQGSETVEVAATLEDIQESTRQNGTGSSRYALIALELIERARASIGEKVKAPVVLNHGDFVLPNLLWDKKQRQLSVVDFEHSGRRNACHDLMAIGFSLRSQLLNPLVSRSIIKLAEKSFWEGYGSIAPEMRILISTLATAGIFYVSLPRLSSRRKRRGWLAGVTATLYKPFLEAFVIKARLGVTL
jgi:hypothetical protein